MQKNCAFVLSLLVVAMALPCPAQSASDQEKNKAVARTFFEEVLGQGKLEKYSDFHAADFVAHGSERNFTVSETSGDFVAVCEHPVRIPTASNATITTDNLSFFIFLLS